MYNIPCECVLNRYGALKGHTIRPLAVANNDVNLVCLEWTTGYQWRQQCPFWRVYIAGGWWRHIWFTIDMAWSDRSRRQLCLHHRRYYYRHHHSTRSWTASMTTKTSGAIIVVKTPTAGFEIKHEEGSAVLHQEPQEWLQQRSVLWIVPCLISMLALLPVPTRVAWLPFLAREAGFDLLFSTKSLENGFIKEHPFALLFNLRHTNMLHFRR